MSTKIISPDDPSGQIGELLLQLSSVYAELDDELDLAYNEIKVKYQPKINELNDLIGSLKALLS